MFFFFFACLATHALQSVLSSLAVVPSTSPYGSPQNLHVDAHHTPLNQLVVDFAVPQQTDFATSYNTSVLMVFWLAGQPRPGGPPRELHGAVRAGEEPARLLGGRGGGRCRPRDGAGGVPRLRTGVVLACTSHVKRLSMCGHGLMRVGVGACVCVRAQRFDLSWCLFMCVRFDFLM